MKIEVEPRYRTHDDAYVHWVKVVPFFANPRGVLVHRVRHASTILYDGKPSHDHANYWCGNGCNAHGLDGWTESPEPNQVLCQRCEQIAVAAGMPSADELAGRHVHVGRAKAVRMCCGGSDGNNSTERTEGAKENDEAAAGAADL